MDSKHIKQRLRDRVAPTVGVRVIPKHAFEGRLGAVERLYVCIGDYDELRGADVATAWEILHGGRRRGEAELKKVYGQWVNLQLGAPVDSGYEPVTHAEYYVIKLDLRANDLDLFPGTWKAMSFIMSDRERMAAALHLHEQFTRVVGNRKPFGSVAKEGVDFYEFGNAIDEDEVGEDNAQHEFYQYLATDSALAGTLVGLFGIDNRCWHGKGYIGSDGYVACRVFLARNEVLSHRSLISCELKRREDVLE